jgi:tetratricopeptide (TPR) repeat protein
LAGTSILHAAPTSQGPTSDQEAETLWKESQVALRESRLQDAVAYLERYVDRYPGKPGYLDAQLLLGQVQLELGHAEEALKPLKYFIHASHNPNDVAKARIALGNSYLKLGKFHEAHLTSIEIERTRNSKKLNSDVYLESRLLAAQALLGLKQNSKAIDILNSAEKQLTERHSAKIKAQTYGLQLTVKIKTCEKFPSKGPLDELQTRDQLNRRGICLLEGLLQFHKILKTEDLRAAGTAALQLKNTYDSYFQSCLHPPVPLQLPHRKRTLKEQKQYQAELANLLVQDCQKKSQDASELLNTWKPQLATSMQGFVDQVSNNLMRAP